MNMSFAMTNPQLAERDRAEILRSAEEARQAVLTPSQVERYLDPPPNTPYPLEYAFHLLGDVRGKAVLDLGCGSGENLVPLSRRGASVIGIDLSPELIALADGRLKDEGVPATLKVGSAYDTGLPDESVEVIFCIALIHHLDIAAVRNEMLRILSRDGFIILSEPIRFSATYNRLRNLLPSRGNISDYEHPLTRDELSMFTGPLLTEGLRYFRVPLLPLVARLFPPNIIRPGKLWKMDRWILRHFRITERYATNVTVRLRKR
jgi:SAM-dependent methyltransferase